MSLIPENQPPIFLNLTPMIDFLFLMLSFFATLALSRATLFDTKVDLVQLKKEAGAHMVSPKSESCQINLSISGKGEYRWITEVKDFPMTSVEDVQKEMLSQYNKGILPEEKTQTEILLHIDKSAEWNSVAKLLYAIRQIGFNAYPIYQQKESP